MATKKEQNRSYYERNKERIKAKSKKYYHENKEIVNSKSKIKRDSMSEEDKAKKADYVKEWVNDNREQHNIKKAIRENRRRAAKLNCTIQVDDEWNDFVISEMYHLRNTRTKETCIDWHVDHIVPLQGKTVCGLHVWYNLRVIPAKLNLIKGNRYYE